MANSSTPSNQPKSSIPTLFTKEIQDLYIRQNFQRLTDYFSNQNQLVTFNFFELNITAAIPSAKTLNHNLGYLPKDIVITQITGPGTIQFIYGSFDATSISYLATGPCRVRFYVGTYFGDQSQVNAQKTDIQTLTSTPEVAALSSSIVSTSGIYTVLGTEKFIFIQSQGSNGTVQLPSISVSKGYSLFIEKTDLNFNPIQIQIFNGDNAFIYPDSVGSTSLNIQYESVQLFCDGLNWYILNRDYPRTWNSAPIQITGSTTNPSPGATQVANILYWRKSGDSIELRLEFSQSSAGVAGSGNYRFQLPILTPLGTQLTLDTSKISTSGDTAVQTLGTGVGYDGTNQFVLIVAYGMNTAIQLFQTNGTGVVGSSLISLGGIVAAFSFEALIPITGWKG